MKLGGTGGANTLTGRAFEERRDFLTLLASQPGYALARRKVAWADIMFEGEVIAKSLRQHSLYRFLEKRGIEWRSLLSKRLLPDEAIFVPTGNCISIVEMKYQQTPGSVDEKLQTCHFKRRQYAKLFAPLGINVEYVYLLGDWFKQSAYLNVLDYIEEVGCRYYFDEVPLADLGLPEKEAVEA